MSSPPADSGTTAAEPGWLASLLFWLALLVGAALYGVVALAPRYLAYLESWRDFRANQVQLVALQQNERYLERTVAALGRDPQFAAELARVDFNAVRPGEETIPVDPHLSLDARTEPEVRVTSPRLPWYAPLVAIVAEQERLRRNLLIAAAVTVLFAFTFLHESETPRIRSAARMVHGGASTALAPLKWLAARYRGNAGS
jgi:cell division protein FtsB